MCGICGDIRRRGRGLPERSVIEAMNRAQAHRGPDDEGVWIEGTVALGHRRLTILDLTDAGKQPMTDPDERVVLTYNGEIYNYVEIRKDLLAKGHRFMSTSDTEVLLRAYLEWGPALLERLNGMYAFALYDFEEQLLFAARDPIGQKPFLYYVNADGFVFASELTALMRHPGVPREIDREALAHYLVYESYIAPYTALVGVRKLPPGHALIYRPETGEMKVWRYWDIINRPPRQTDALPGEADYAELEEVLRQAVGRHLRSDVPVGIYLSGGVDSNTLVSLASDLLGAENVHTYTVANPVPSFNEADQARMTAEQLGTDHHETTLTAERCLATVPQILDLLDEPLSDPGLIAAYQVAHFASQHVKVILSGDGGDEFFYGYAPFSKWHLSETLERLPLGLSQGILRPLVEMTPAQYGYMGLFFQARLFLRGLGRPAPVRNMAWIGSFMPGEVQELLLDGADLQTLRPDSEGIEAVYEHVANIHRRTQAFDPIARLGIEYQTTYLPYCICSHTDKANMMVSLEARSPFLDVEVMRYVNELPTSWKLRNGTSKWIMRRILHRRLGQAVGTKKKQGFTVPLALWLRHEIKDMAQRLLDPDLITAGGLFRPEEVNRLWNEHQSGKANHYKKLWTLVVFQSWWQRHLSDA
jgi:asparagine synthase (glutamine-hydrolysing)